MVYAGEWTSVKLSSIQAAIKKQGCNFQDEARYKSNDGRIPSLHLNLVIVARLLA